MGAFTESQFELAFGAVGVLLTIAIGWFIVNLFKNMNKEQQVLDSKPVATSEQAKSETVINDSKPVIAEKSAAPVAVESEVEVDLKHALKKTEENLFGRIRSLFSANSQTNHLEEIEEILYTSDLGPQTVQRLMQALEENLSRKEKADYSVVRETLKNEMMQIFETANQGKSEIRNSDNKPTVLMIVGVNGAGKTTSIGKISAQFAQQGKKVLVAAGDTFRAAAGGQLKVWTDRAQVEIFSPEGVTDPSAVAFDAISKGKAQGYDIVIVDTAGRLHTQANLMEELKKMKRVMTKVIEDAPHEVLIVLDANSGQNALIQAREFHNALGLTGVVLTKMDGTAKGGVAVGVAQDLKIPIKLIGVGERIQDLRKFSHREFVDSIFQ